MKSLHFAIASGGYWQALVLWLAACSSGVTDAEPFVPDEPGGGGSAATIVWSSDWRTATGSGDPAITDGGRWNRRLCGGTTDVVDIVAGNTVDWSLAGKVMRVRRNGQRCTQVDALDVEYPSGNRLANPALGLSDGQSYYIRMYARVDLTGGQDGANHPVAINTLGNIQMVPWSPRFQGSPALPQNTYNPEMAIGMTTGAASDGHWVPRTPLPTRTWYRFEYYIEFVRQLSGNQWSARVWPRIYDMAGNLVRDADTFNRQPGWGNPTQTLQQWYDSGGLVNVSDVRYSHNFGVGYEGPAGAANTGEFWYYGAVAIGTGDWIGPR